MTSLPVTNVSVVTSPLELTFNDLEKFAGERLGYGRGVDLAWTTKQKEQITETMDSAVRQVYFPPPIPGERVPHQWRATKPIADIVISNELSSTLSSDPLTSAVETAIQINGGLTFFRDNMAQGHDGNTPDEIIFATSENVYEIKSITSPSEIVVKGDATGETTTFQVRRRGTVLADSSSLFGLPDDVRNIELGVPSEEAIFRFWMSTQAPPGETAALAAWGVEFDNDPQTTKDEYVVDTNGFVSEEKVILDVDTDTQLNPQANFIADGAGFYILSPAQTATQKTLSRATSTVTLTDAILTSSNVGETMTISGTGYTIEKVISSKQCVVTGALAGVTSGDSATIARTGDADYDLPADFGGLSGPVVLVGDTPRPKEIRLTGEGEINQRRQRTTARTGKPQVVATRPAPFNPAVGHRLKLMVDPAPDATYTLRVPFYVKPEKLTAAARFTRLGMEHAELIKQSILSIVEQIDEEAKGVQWERFMERLVASVYADRIRSEPEKLGVMTDNRTVARHHQHGVGNFTVSYEGPVT